MLQRIDTFLKAKQLNISNRQYNALIGVIALLKSGKLTYKENYNVDVTVKGFNLGYWFQHTDSDCGSIGCIGGWAEWVDARERKVRWEWHGLFPMEMFNKYCDEFHEGLNSLMYPDIAEYDEVTPQQAAKAVQNYLTTGYPDWEEIIGK